MFGENMKFKYLFALTLILAALIMAGNAAATENVSHDANSSQVTCISQEITYNNPAGTDVGDSEVIIASSSPDETDLTVDMEIGDVRKHTYGINEMSFDVPLIISANAVGGTAKNTQINIIIPDNFEYVSSDSSVGTYDAKSGIWNIGDLKSGTEATLNILTKIATKGKFTIFANGTTDSKDIDQENNALKCDVEVTSKISSNTTHTSAQQNEAQHNSHYASMAQSGYRQEVNWNDMPDRNEQTAPDYEEPEVKPDPQNPDPNIDEDPGKKQDPAKDPEKREENSQTGENGNEGQNTQTSVSKEVNSNILAAAANTLSNAISSIFNTDSVSDNANPFNSKIIKAIKAIDYRTIPILIFALFLIIIICNMGYEKIKS